MTPGDIDELREIFQPLTADIDTDDFPDVTTATLAAREEAA